ncbi:MAG: hypothetical protein ACLFQ8_01725 [Candidatus Aenigmatarchaeota archaeon]
MGKMKGSDKAKNPKIPESEVKRAVEESYLSNTISQNSDCENAHFSSVIKEIDGEDEETYLVKIRPPLFSIYGLLSNLSRAFSGINNTKIMDNEKWVRREVEHFKELYPEMVADDVDLENAFLMEKIDGEVASRVLSSVHVDPEEKVEVIREMTKALKLLHEKDRFHGEPNTENCIIGDDGDVYWIDFETEYDESLKEEEKRAKDLEQLMLSVLGAFNEEGEVGMDDKEIIEKILEVYDDEEIISVVENDPSLPLIGPHRVYQFSCNSVMRFYRAQKNIMDYFDDTEKLDLEDIFSFSS